MTAGDKVRLSKALSVRNLYISVPHLRHGSLMEAMTVIKQARVGHWACCTPLTFYVMHKTGILFARISRSEPLAYSTSHSDFIFFFLYIFYIL